MPTPATTADLLTLLDSGASLLLPNARAARNLRLAFDHHQQALGRAVWQPASALSWDQWTASLWSDLIVSGAEPRLLLNPAQEHTLWREIISTDPATSALASPDALADLAHSAFHLAASYNATSRLRAAATTHDTRTFADWAAAFTRLCATRACLSPPLLEDALRQHLDANTLAPPATLHLVGFPSLHPALTPAQESLLTPLRQRGTRILHHHLVAGSTTFHASTIAPTEHDELTLAARWIRSFLETHPSPAQARVAVLVPNLTDDRAELESVFRDILAPELHSIATDLSSTPWEIAAGVPLAGLPIIAVALDLARWATGPLPLERVSSLLLSPYIGDLLSPTTTTPTTTTTTTTPPPNTTIQPREIIAQFDARILRRAPRLRPEITLSALLTLLESSKARTLTTLHQPPLLWPRHLHTFLERHGDLTRPRTFAEWAEFLRDLLRSANWPNHSDSTTSRILTATEAAAAEAWDNLLDLLATLDFSGRRVPFAAALEELQRHAHTTPFHPPQTYANVQVMSPTDSAGSVFDATLFLHATDASWPPPQRANPLIPWTLQRTLRMPGTDPTLTAAHASAFTADLLARSTSVLFTSAAETSDGHLRPSPLLAEFNLPSLDTADLAANSAPTPLIPLDIHPDDTPLPAPPAAEVYGGARVLKLQASCGFLAFAELRLRATQPESAPLGLDPGESGTLLHRVLQLFWSYVHTQAALRAMPAPERTELLHRCLDDVLPTPRSASPWDTAYLSVQKDRQLALLQPWLDQELQRGPFTVLSLEDEQHITVGPLTLAVRMDRIDQVSGGVFFVDYKTGFSAGPAQWDGPRPDDPQLPLYSLLPEPDELKGIAFARIRAGRDMGWLGLQSAPGILPAARGKHVLNDVPETVAAWRATLTQLAEDFHAGHASVDPKEFPNTCARCAQRLLCRLDPAALHGAFNDDSTETYTAEDASHG